MSALTCDQVMELRLERAGGPLEAEVEASWSSHVASCADCTAFAHELDELEAQLTETLQAASVPRQPGHTAARVLARIQSEPAAAQPVVHAGGLSARPAPTRGGLGRWALAAAVALAAGLGFLGLRPGAPVEGVQLARGGDERAYVAGEPLRPGDRLVAEGDVEPVTLPAATLEAAAGSELRLEQLEPRMVTLVRGQVRCQVTPGSGQFFVLSDLGRVAVVGTHFTVRRDADALWVGVESGVVRVSSRRGDQESVGAGQEARVTLEGAVEVHGDAPPAPVEEPPPAESPAPTVVPVPQHEFGHERDEVLASLVNDVYGATFSVEGQALWLPNDASVHVSLTTPGVGPNLLRVAFFKVQVHEGRYRGSFHWPKLRLAPLTYRVEVEMRLASQAPAIRQLLIRDHGYSTDGRILLSTSDVGLGEHEQRRDHSEGSLNGIRQIVQRIQALVPDVEALGQVPEREFEARALALQARIRSEQDQLTVYKSEYVIRAEADLVEVARGSLGRLFELTADPGVHASVVQSVARSLEQTLLQIDSRLPLDLPPRDREE